MSTPRREGGGKGGTGDHERARASSVRPAAHRAGHGGAGPAAGPRPRRGAPRHPARLPPLRHGRALRHRGAHRGGRRRGRACGGRRLPRGALHHVQGLVRRRAPGQGAPGAPPDAQVRALLPLLPYSASGLDFAAAIAASEIYMLLDSCTDGHGS